MGYFDRFFKAKPTRIGLWLARRAMYQALDRLLKHRDVKSVVEVGPGRGFFGKACIEKGINYLGIDCNQKGCEILLTKGLEMIQTYVPPFPEGIKLADAFVAIHVIEHMPTLQRIFEFVEGARDLLNEDGLILLAEPDIRYIKDWF